MQNIEAFKENLAHAKKVAILTHPKPDADALGSSLGLAGFLQKLGKETMVISPTDYPEFLNWLPGNENVRVFNKKNENMILETLQVADMIFCLDFSRLNRIFELGEKVRTSPSIIVHIDHHLEPEDFSHFSKLDVKAASTAELVFELIREMEMTDKIDASIAECLYAGLMTDTGGFRHANTNKKVFQVAGELVDLGANPYKVSKLIYENNALERLRLTGYVLMDKLQIFPEFRTAIVCLSQQDLKKFKSQTGDTEGLVNFGLSVKEIRLSILIQEKKDQIKLSFRSLGDFSVNDFAKNHFEGGGHKNAAGGQSKISLEKTLEKVLTLLPQYQQDLQNYNA